MESVADQADLTDPLEEAQAADVRSALALALRELGLAVSECAGAGREIFELETQRRDRKSRTRKTGSVVNFSLVEDRYGRY